MRSVSFVAYLSEVRIGTGSRSVMRKNSAGLPCLVTCPAVSSPTTYSELISQLLYPREPFPLNSFEFANFSFFLTLSSASELSFFSSFSPKAGRQNRPGAGLVVRAQRFTNFAIKAIYALRTGTGSSSCPQSVNCFYGKVGKTLRSHKNQFGDRGYRD